MQGNDILRIRPLVVAANGFLLGLIQLVKRMYIHSPFNLLYKMMPLILGVDPQ